MSELFTSDRSLRIAMTSYYMPSGSKIGVGYQVHAMANAMTDRGHEVTVFTVCPPSDGARYRTVRISSPPRFRTFAFAWSLRRIDFSGYDVLHAHGDDYWLWRRRVPVHVRTMHGSCLAEALHIPGMKEKVRMLALGLSEALVTGVADRTVLVSPDTRRYMPWVRTVIPNGVDGRIFHPDPTERAKRPTILFVGTYLNRKRGKLLLDVFQAEVRPKIPTAHLIMVCSDAPESDGVSVTGRITDEELASWYRKAWVFCLPSTYEGFGIPYAEALMSGTPVVASPNPGSRYVLADGRFGDIVDDSHLGKALVGLLMDKDRRRSSEVNSVRRSRSFSMDEVIGCYEQLYAEVGSSRHIHVSSRDHSRLR